MTTSATSFGNWLRSSIQSVLERPAHGGPPPLLIWCDPERAWKGLLAAAAKDGAFDLWADEDHELELRERCYSAPAAPRVVWLPTSRERMTYLKVFELASAEVREWTLAQALAAYGVEIPPQHLAELEPLLKAHVLEWFDRPRAAWNELTPGNAQDTLVDDDLILEYLTTLGLGFERLQAEERFSVFARRVADDFGLPGPSIREAEQWRIGSLASLLCTDAAVKVPENPPGEPERIIPPGPQRDRALKLLARWQKQVDLAESFETLAPRADALTSLQFWARNLNRLPGPLASPMVEATLFQVQVERLAAADAFDDLAKTLDTNLPFYDTHAVGFWGKHAKTPIAWASLVELASVSALLSQESGVEAGWRTVADAVGWFVRSGWAVDQAGETLFQQHAAVPGALMGVLAKLRRAYLRHFDHTNGRFAELLAQEGVDSLGLGFAGEAVSQCISALGDKEGLAVLVLDAFRYDLGERLADRLNRGEPSRRASVSAVRSTVPSVTMLGMPFSLAGGNQNLVVDVVAGEKPFWRVRASGFPGNLSDANQRKEWLKQVHRLKAKSLLAVDQLADPSPVEEVATKTHGRVVLVFGREADDHDCVLQPYGLDQTLDRYATVIRRLRKGGYSTILVVTDHGFFHWNPEPDEKDLAKPTGEVLLSSRRAVVGRDLNHPSALKLKVTASDLDCCVPRATGVFKTYGGLGFFHGGVTLQELVIPVVTIRWPKKAKKVGVILKPVAQITSLCQRVEVVSAEQQQELLGEVSQSLVGRQIVVKVVNPLTGKSLFKGKQPLGLEATGEAETVELVKVEGAEGNSGLELSIQVEDADDGELLDRRTVTLKVDLDEWL